MKETQIRSLGWEDPLEKEMATHSSILAWRIHGQRSLVGYSPWGHKESDRLNNFHLYFSEWASVLAQLVKKSACNAGDLGSIPGLGRSPGEGNSYSLQHSGLENSMDCIVHGVTESDTTE